MQLALSKILEGGEFLLIKAGHWGSLVCTSGCCSIPVSGTPRVAHTHARDLLREARKHPLDEDHPRNRRRKS